MAFESASEVTTVSKEEDNGLSRLLAAASSAADCVRPRGLAGGRAGAVGAGPLLVGDVAASPRLDGDVAAA